MDRKKLADCLVRTQKGDKGAFSRFYAETARGVFAFLYGYYRAYHRTEDATQDVYLKALKNVASYRPGTDARAWLLQIAKNTALNDLKRERREAYLPEEEFERILRGERAETSAFEALERALNERERDIVLLHVLWGFKHREIAEQLGLPLGTVTSKYKDAIAKLKKFLKEETE